MTEPTKQAMRAAEHCIVWIVSTGSTRVTLPACKEIFAELIDRETGLSQLLDEIKRLRHLIDEHHCANPVRVLPGTICQLCYPSRMPNEPEAAWRERMRKVGTL
jgi:hypothetical protein